MRVPPHILAAVVSGFLRLGPLHLPVFGVVAAAGLVAALWLSQQTARLAGLDAHCMWDAGVVAIVSAFVASRLLLVSVNLRLFVAQPLLVLAQPSLTLGGLAFTTVLVWLFLHRKRLPLLRVLDAWAAPAALLTAFLQLGHFLEGSDSGMPTALPWGVPPRGGPAGLHVHPVQLYAFVAYFALSLFLFWRSRQRFSRFTGQLVSVGLASGGAISFFSDMLRQPSNTADNGWLDPEQWAALLFIMAGASLWTLLPRPWEPELSRDFVAERLAEFVEGGGRGWFWDGFWHEHFTDPLLVEVQQRCLLLETEFPPAEPGWFCAPAGVAVIQKYTQRLKEAR